MPFNTAAALKKIRSEIPEPAIPANSAIRGEFQCDDVANRLLIGCYSEGNAAEIDQNIPEIGPEMDFQGGLEPAVLGTAGRPSMPDAPRADVRFSNVVPFNPNRDPLSFQEGDDRAYADALRIHGPSGYGGIAFALGWSSSRASAAETVLRLAGRISYDHTGRGVFVEEESQ